jgi:hypothetical protein
MVSVETQEQILDLHARGMKMRAIARKTCTSRSTVGYICERGHVVEPPKKKAHSGYESAGRILHNVAKCPQCHRMVSMPCRACALPKRTEPAYEPPGTDLSPDLIPDDHARYEQVRDRIFSQMQKHGKDRENWDKFSDLADSQS